jgi:hypothetical protein
MGRNSSGLFWTQSGAVRATLPLFGVVYGVLPSSARGNTHEKTNNPPCCSGGCGSQRRNHSSSPSQGQLCRTSGLILVVAPSYGLTIINIIVCRVTLRLLLVQWIVIPHDDKSEKAKHSTKGTATYNGRVNILLLYH